MKMPDYKPPTVEEELKSRREHRGYDKTTQSVDRRIEAEDAAGVEIEMMNFSDCDDGHGNNVMHGDLSIQRRTEEDRNRVLNQGP